jgi:hypothetical protein
VFADYYDLKFSPNLAPLVQISEKVKEKQFRARTPSTHSCSPSRFNPEIEQKAMATLSSFNTRVGGNCEDSCESTTKLRNKARYEESSCSEYLCITNQFCIPESTSVDCKKSSVATKKMNIDFVRNYSPKGKKVINFSLVFLGVSSAITGFTI